MQERARRIWAERWWALNPLHSRHVGLRLAALEAEVAALQEEAKLAVAAIGQADALLEKTRKSFRSRDVTQARSSLLAARAFLGGYL